MYWWWNTVFFHYINQIKNCEKIKCAWGCWRFTSPVWQKYPFTNFLTACDTKWCHLPARTTLSCGWSSQIGGLWLVGRHTHTHWCKQQSLVVTLNTHQKVTSVGWKLWGGLICTNHVFFCQFSWWPGVILISIWIVVNIVQTFQKNYVLVLVQALQ